MKTIEELPRQKPPNWVLGGIIGGGIALLQGVLLFQNYPGATLACVVVSLFVSAIAGYVGGKLAGRIGALLFGIVAGIVVGLILPFCLVSTFFFIWPPD